MRVLNTAVNTPSGTIGLERALTKNGLANLAQNSRRLAFHNRRAAHRLSLPQDRETGQAPSIPKARQVPEARIR